MKKDDENISYKLGKNVHNCKDKDDEDKKKLKQVIKIYLLVMK